MHNVFITPQELPDEVVQLKKVMVNYWIDMGILVSSLLCISTGIIKWPGLIDQLSLSYSKVPILLLSNIHDWSGMIMGALAFVHVVLHLKWLTTITKNTFLGKFEIQKLNKKHISFILGLLVLLNMSIYLSESVIVQSENISELEHKDELIAYATDEKNQEIVSADVVVEKEDYSSLAGTCPRDRHCGSPSCPLWTDQNNDGLCDRG